TQLLWGTLEIVYAESAMPCQQKFVVEDPFFYERPLASRGRRRGQECQRRRYLATAGAAAPRDTRCARLRGVRRPARHRGGALETVPNSRARRAPITPHEGRLRPRVAVTRDAAGSSVLCGPHGR